MNNDSITSNNPNNVELNVPFHTEKYWDDFYKENPNTNYDWYFELNILKSSYFDLANLNPESEILILGIGNSSIIDFFIKNKFQYVTCVDFSSYLIHQLKEKYEKREECSEFDFVCRNVINMTKQEKKLEMIPSLHYDYVIDKACIDCLLTASDGEESFVKALTEINISLKENGSFYYFSTGKPDKRVSLLTRVFRDCKIDIEEIDIYDLKTNDLDFYRDFNDDDNIYYVYIIIHSGFQGLRGRTFIHMMSESAIPAEPTREEEVSYLKYLVKSFSSDPWFTLHPKMYQASPHRLWYKNYFEYRKEYRKTFLKNFLLSDFFAWPLIIYLANRRRYHSTGVPATYLKNSMMNPTYRLETSQLNAVPRRRFAWGVIKYALIFGYLGAYFFTDSKFKVDDLKMRPDMQIGRILTDVPLREKRVHDFFSSGYFDREFDDKPQSMWKKALKYLYPYQFYNPTEYDYLPFYDYTKDYVTPSMENHYHFKQ